MTLHFAYGANMARAPMRVRCPTATALGPAELDGYRFVITADGYGSVVPAAGGKVHGVLWRLAPRDLAALNLFERLDNGLYVRAMLPVVIGGRRSRALVYVGRSRTEGRPQPAYLETVVDAARDWCLPPRYVTELQRWASSGYRALRPAETGEI